MRIFDLPDDELAAVTAALRGVVEDDRYPRAPRLDALRAALGRLRRPQSHPALKGPAASQSRQAGAAIIG